MASSSYVPAHRDFFPEYYFSGGLLHRHHYRVSDLNMFNITPPTYLPPNYIHRGGYNVEEVFVGIQLQDEAMILDAVQFMPQTINPNTIQTYNVGENNQVFQGDEALIVDAIQLPQQNPMCIGGLSKRAISKYLKTRKGNDDDGSQVCVICQDGLLSQEDDHTIGVLNCGHKFHVKCIKKWLHVKNLCPLCKST